MTNNQPTAAVLIIGDEILSGRTQDLNVRFIAAKLSDRGIQLEEVRVVPDKEDNIIEALNALRKKYKYVFTTGGIGPTHDDITAHSVAKAFGVELERNAEAVKMVKEHYKEKNKELYEGAFSMAEIPKGAVLINNSVSGAPGFSIDNVFVFAGVPEIAQAMFNNIEDKLEEGRKFVSKTVKVYVGESAIKDVLHEVHSMDPDVQLGSYPFTHNKRWCASVVIRGQDSVKIDKVTLELKKKLRAYNIGFLEEE